MLGKNLITAAAGNAGGGDVLGIEDVFSTWLYTGNGYPNANTQTISNGIDLADKGGMVWVKSRSNNASHYLFDTARGVNKGLSSHLTNAQASYTESLTSFNSTGFTLGTGQDATTNENNYTFASWTFRKAEKFFDVVTYTGTGSARTVAHNLGSVPGCIIIKQTNGNSNWFVYHRSTGNTQYLMLNLSNAATSASTLWNNTSPTSSVFTLGTASGVNTSGATYVAYLFAHDAGGFGDDGTESVIKCGSYTGTSAVGNFVELGWEPQWVMVKKASGGNANNYNWTIVDNMRGAPVLQVNSVCPYLHPNTTGAESLDYPISPSPTGFIVNNPGGLVNDSGATFIYIAIRRGPMKTPEDATTVFDTKATANGDSAATTGFPVDACLWTARTGSTYNFLKASRVTGSSTLQTASTSAENTGYISGTVWQTNDGMLQRGVFSGTTSVTSNFFRRAPGFFDAVCYTGTGSARTVSHSLGVAPELMIVKKRNLARQWAVYSAGLTADEFLLLNSTNAKSNGGAAYWNSTRPTSSVFSVGTDGDVNASADTYIAYLFATCPGVSKCFNFTGTGTTLQIDCGFASGARFVMIKRTDSTGDWYVWDSARGIISGNDPYLLLNSTAAEVTSTDYIDPYSAGFEISSSAPAAINASGGSYIGLAIA